jgi:hypothetical protein
MRLSEIYNLDSRKSFSESWLSEMPSGLGQFETYDAASYTIKDFIHHGIQPVSVRADLFTINIATTVLYWHGSADGKIIDLAIELRKQSEALVVTMLGKNPALKGRPPFASMLYSAIVQHAGENVRVMSDAFLSDEGLKVWKKLVQMGHKVSVYDSAEPGKSFKTFSDPSELDAFIANADQAAARYQFVLSEGIENLLQLRSSFNLRRHRESVNGLL